MMKWKFNTLMMLALLSSASCQEKANVKMTFHLHDESGNPVENATIRAHTFDHWEPGEAFGKDVSVTTEGKSDALGDCVMTTDSLRGEFTYNLYKQGYYDTTMLNYKFEKKVQGEWQPWNPIIKSEIRKIIKPIPLIVKKVPSGASSSVMLPAFNTAVGYDLELGDWTTPYGKGKTADILFRIDGKTDDGYVPYHATMEITFSNENDGFFLYKADPYTGSQLKLPHLAPEKGYTSRIIKTKSRSVKSKPLLIGESPEEIVDDTESNENYYLRIRTKTNSKGEIISACYAKVYGPFMWYANGFVSFKYYFNPTPNDRNLEFDPKRNLLNLPEEQQVKEP